MDWREIAARLEASLARGRDEEALQAAETLAMLAGARRAQPELQAMETHTRRLRRLVAVRMQALAEDLDALERCRAHARACRARHEAPQSPPRPSSERT